MGVPATNQKMPPKKKDDKKGGKSDSKKNLKDFLAKSKGGASAKKKKEAASWKLVTPSVLSERLKINGSLARRAIKELLNAGSLRLIDKHSAQQIYTRNTGDDA